MSKSNTKGCVKVLVMKNTGLQKMKIKRLQRTHGTQGQYYHHGIPAVGKINGIPIQVYTLFTKTKPRKKIDNICDISG